MSRLALLVVPALALAPIQAFAQVPAAPANLQAEYAGNGVIALSWDHPGDPGITGYDFRGQVGSDPRWRPDWTAFSSSDADTIGARFGNFASGLRVLFEMRARNGNGPGASASVTARTPPHVTRVTLVLTPPLIDEDGDEDSGVARVTASVDVAAYTSFSVEVSAEPVPPATTGDYVLSGSVLRFARFATTSTGTVTIAAVDDTEEAADALVTVSGSVGSVGSVDDADVRGPGSVTLTIRNDDFLTQPPTVTVTADSTAVAPSGAVLLTATASDPDGGEVAYAWSAGSGSFDETDAAAATWTAPAEPGPVEIRVTVTDDEGETASAAVTVTVTDDDPPPPPSPTQPPTVTVTADSTAVAPGGAVLLTATASDPDGGEVAYAWSAGSGSFDAADAAAAMWTAPAEPGPVEIRVTVTDDEGETASAAVTVTVTDDDPPPPPPPTEPPTVTVTAVATAVAPGGAVLVTATASDPDGGELSYSWRAPTGGFDATDRAAATWTAPSEPGPVEIRVTVTDDEGETASAAVTVLVAAPPTLTVAADPTSVAMGGAVLLTATASDPDGGELTYAWRAPSGRFDATDRAAATWTAPSEPGAVEIRVTVTDDEGETASAAVTVTVTAPPAVQLAADPASVVTGGAVLLTATASDPDGGELSYSWRASSGGFVATDRATATWTAPSEPGAVEIRVTVTDDEGETASAAVTVTVLEPVPTLTGSAALLLAGLLLIGGVVRGRRAVRSPCGVTVSGWPTSRRSTASSFKPSSRAWTSRGSSNGSR